MMRRVATLTLGMMIGACAPAEGPLSTVKDEEAQPRVEAFEGRVQMQHPNGGEAGNMKILTRTRTFPAQNLIIEQTIQVDDASPDNPKELIVMITVDGEAMTLVELRDQFTGAGTFNAGRAWEWTDWSFDATLEDGLVMSSHMTKSGSTVNIEQELKSASGDLMFKFDGSMSEISNAAFKRKYKEIFPDADDDSDDDDIDI